MSNASSNIDGPRSPGKQGQSEELRADGSSASARRRAAVDEPTIVSNRPPTACPAASDSATRILEGHVMPGDRLGVFELVEYVGGGGMGRVFRARDTQLGRTVAIKVLPPDQAVDTDAAQRFQNEAQSAARLDHENIARVYGVGEDRGLLYIVFEFVEGVNIRELVNRNGPLALADALSYTLQVAEALAHADARNVVHRDIKPSNVLITPEGRVKLIDMGLARLRHVEASGADLTVSGVTLGTFDYISPEQARDPRSADVRSDMYSLGCTFFFMLAGQPPFPEGTVLQKLLQHQADEPPDIRQFRPDLPESATQLLRKMMAKDPQRRHASPGELAAELLQLAEETGVEAVGPAGRAWWTAQPKRATFVHRHLPWIAPMVALALVVLVLHIYWSWSTAPDQMITSPTDIAAATGGNETDQPGAAMADIGEAELRPRDATSPASGIKEESVPASASSEGSMKRQMATTSKPTTTSRMSKDAADSYAGARHGGQSDALRTDAGGAGISSPSRTAPSRRARPAEPLADDARRSVGGPSDAPATRSDVLVVSNTAGGSNEFSSLGAACAAAHDGDVIELRFNGPHEERPIRIANLQLTVRAGDGYRPVVVFRPTEINPVKYPRSMFTLTAGRLTLSDVAMELHVPTDVPVDNWSLVETCGGQGLRLERCSLSVRNAFDQLASYRPMAAVIRARPAPDVEVVSDGAPAATPLATIELVDCIARGEAAFLCVEDLQPVYLLWDNGLLASSDSFLIASGGQAAPKVDEMLRLELRHVTAVVHGGLCRLGSTASNPYQLTVQFVCTDDIILTAPGVPLIDQESTASLEKAHERLLWNGDRNYYQHVGAFWLVRNADPMAAADEMAFDAWKAFWGPSRESRPSQEPLRWKREAIVDQPPHRCTPADYALDDRAFSETEAGLPGCRAERLPPLPQAMSPARTSSADSGDDRGGVRRADRS